MNHLPPLDYTPVSLPPQYFELLGSGSWTEKELYAIVNHIKSASPSVILELGCGTSTVILSYILKMMKSSATLVSLENTWKWSRFVKRDLKKRGLDDHTRVIHAPIKTIKGGGKFYKCYNPNRVKLSEPVDFVIIDGPNGTKYGRTGTLFLIEKYLTDKTVVFLHDAARLNIEQEAIRVWKDYYGERFEYRYELDTAQDDYHAGKGFAVMQLHS